MMQKRKTVDFSVALGLFDYINPVFYAVTSITIAVHLHGAASPAVFALYALGALVSLFFGLAIPTVKLLVGLGRMPFKMPVNLVAFVNSGILLSGLMLFAAVLHPPVPALAGILAVILILLGLVYGKTKKANTIAVLTGAFGYILIYAAMIVFSLRSGALLPVVLYGIAILLFIALCLIGMRADLKDARIHWVIEISNVLCQLCVMLATLLSFGIL